MRQFNIHGYIHGYPYPRHVWVCVRARVWKYNVFKYRHAELDVCVVCPYPSVGRLVGLCTRSIEGLGLWVRVLIVNGRRDTTPAHRLPTAWRRSCPRCTFPLIPGLSRNLDLDLDDSCQTPAGYCGIRVCMPVGTIQPSAGCLMMVPKPTRWRSLVVNSIQ